MIREAVWLSGVVEFALVEQILMRIGGIEMSRSSVWRSDQRWGKRMAAVEAREREKANCLPGVDESVARIEAREKRMGVAMDGAMVPIRNEGWKELKLGSVFEVAVLPTVDEQTNEVIDLAHAVRNSYVAHLGGPDLLGELTWSEAQRRGWEHAPDTLVISDGAPWIWNQVAIHFGQSRQLVDWYHAKAHLADCARMLKGEGTPACHRWLNSRETRLYQGHAAHIADELCQLADPHPCREHLQREAAYFRSQQHRMNYLEMRENQWPLGSGMIESAAKQFKHRFCGPGMRWSRSGLENLLPIRSAILSNRFDSLWTKAYAMPPK